MTAALSEHSTDILNNYHAQGCILLASFLLLEQFNLTTLTESLGMHEKHPQEGIK